MHVGDDGGKEEEEGESQGTTHFELGVLFFVFRDF